MDINSLINIILFEMGIELKYTKEFVGLLSSINIQQILNTILNL